MMCWIRAETTISLVTCVVVFLLVSMKTDMVINASEFSPTSNSDTFYLTNISDLNLQTLLNSWKQLALMRCALQCANAVECTGFLWGRTDETCSIGHGVAAGAGVHRDFRMDLYTKSQLIGMCRNDLGYRLISSNRFDMRCVYLSTESTDYFQARRSCQERGGDLFKANSSDLLTEAMAIARQENRVRVRVGLTDIDDEGIYVWSDGDVMPQAQIPELFGYGQPDNGGYDEEDCMEIHLYLRGLNDGGCSELMQYLCDIYF